MKTVIYSCPFVPAEWIAAHGLRPERIIPSLERAPRALAASQGLCPYALAFIGEACSTRRADAAVMTTVCDQMRRAAELVADRAGLALFLMHVPATWQTVAAQKLYGSELERLGRFLVRLGGKHPAAADLAAVMLDHDERRAALRAARGRLSPRAFSEAIARFHRDGTLESNSDEAPPRKRGVPVALVGGPLLPHHFELFDLIEESGGTVALDATGTGERTLPAPLDRREVRRDPMAVLAGAYFGSIPDAFRRPNSGLYVWLKNELAARDIAGILFIRHTWCDTWHAEAQRMKEWSLLPFITVESSGDSRVDGRTVSRVQSFMEVLT